MIVSGSVAQIDTAHLLVYFKFWTIVFYSYCIVVSLGNYTVLS